MEYKVYDWAGNEVGSPIFDDWNDACDWMSQLVDKVYPNLDDNEHDEQLGEYQIIELT